MVHIDVGRCFLCCVGLCSLLAFIPSVLLTLEPLLFLQDQGQMLSTLNSP